MVTTIRVTEDTRIRLWLLKTNYEYKTKKRYTLDEIINILMDNWFKKYKQ